MISPEEEMKVFHLLDNKLGQIAESIGYNEEPAESEEHKALEDAWRSYLEGIGLRSVGADFRPEEDLYMSFDPLYTVPGRILIPWDVFERILVVGLP